VTDWNGSLGSAREERWRRLPVGVWFTAREAAERAGYQWADQARDLFKVAEHLGLAEVGWRRVRGKDVTVWRRVR
jgi:hypothetical protein